MAERIRSAIEQHPFDLGSGQYLRRTCSIGFACLPFVAEEPKLYDWEQVVDLADQCLYAAKRSGRNRWFGLLPPSSGNAEQLMLAPPLDVNRLIANHSPWIRRSHLRASVLRELSETLRPPRRRLLDA